MEEDWDKIISDANKSLDDAYQKSMNWCSRFADNVFALSIDSIFEEGARYDTLRLCDRYDGTVITQSQKMIVFDQTHSDVIFREGDSVWYLQTPKTFSGVLGIFFELIVPYENDETFVSVSELDTYFAKFNHGLVIPPCYHSHNPEAVALKKI